MVADEAQDLSAIELKLLIDTTGKQRSVTLAGDVAQRLVFDNHFSTWEELLDTLGIQASSNATLKLGYRSTGEVMALASSLLGDLAIQESAKATRHGAPVELICFHHQGEAIEMLASALRSLIAREPLASVTVIARYAAQAAAYAKALRGADVAGVRLVEDQEFSFKPGIEVTTVADVKGLEFDYVILVDVSNATYPDNLESRHLLHIGATRAAHQLWMLAVGKPSPLVPKHLATL
jgi:DNA helicase-2/ATP-dependent DNA helicase PcrA